MMREMSGHSARIATRLLETPVDPNSEPHTVPLSIEKSLSPANLPRKPIALRAPVGAA